MRYQLNQDDIFDFVSFVGAETRRRGDELQFRYCPQCGSPKDEWKFSLNLKSGLFNCPRSSCGYRGHFVQLARDKGYQIRSLTEERYKRIKQPKEIKIRDTAIEYFAGRGISEATVRKFKVTARADNPSVLMFPFFDENGVLRFVKYRKTRPGDQPKEFSEKDTMPILFGMSEATDTTKPLIITEGQIDSMSVAEAGFENAVSVPTGCMGFTWLPRCQEWMERFPELIIFGDCEKGKITLVDQLTKSLRMPIRIVRKRDYLGEKDANDILRSFGPEAIKEAIKNAEPPKVTSVKRLSDVARADLDSLPSISTRIGELDKMLGGLIMGQVILLTGKRGNGKSTFLSQLICDALDQGENVFAYSGELANSIFKWTLDLQLAGFRNLEKYYDRYGEERYRVTDEAAAKISDWYKDRMFVYENSWTDEEAELQSLPDVIEETVRQYGTRIVCVDNLMSAMEVVTNNTDLYTAQSRFVGRLKKIAARYDILIILVAHPRKENGSDSFDVDNVSGSADITNKVDIVLNYDRAGEGDEEDALLQIGKNRLLGNTLMGKGNGIRLVYDHASRRITGMLEYKAFKIEDNTRRYGWETFNTAKQVELEI